jgi:hypothetical protein|tara:strand:- start:1623 stop:1802 length:180 start_codon:yes stop_codon:yes gene_type:complete
MKKIKIEFTEDELHSIMSTLTVKSMGGNLDADDKTLGKKIHEALKKLEDKNEKSRTKYA